MSRTIGPACLLVLASCTSDPELGAAAGEVTLENGTRLNGASLNGTRLNGTATNGTKLNGVSLNGVRLNGVRLNGTAIDGTLLTGSLGLAPDGGGSVEGSTWTGTVTLPDWSWPLPISLRIDRAIAEVDLWSYEVSYRTLLGWQPLCGVEADGVTPIRALAVAGTWSTVEGDSAHYAASTTDFTWACRGASIAKCVELGYRPWEGHADYLASCVRLLRGDFCGSGNAYTVDGTLLNLYDNLGIERDTESWRPEAAWGPRGAVCVNKENAARYDLVLSSDPKCVKSVRTKDCGTFFPPGAYLIDELP